MNKKEAADRAGSVLYLYLFKEVKTGKVIYVGQTRFLGRRITEHIRALKDLRNYAAIYVYMRNHNLEFFRDVEISIIFRGFDRAKMEALETEYINKYSTTVQNMIKVDTRKYNTDPRFKKVRCITTGEVFWAVNPVLEKYNISRYFLEKAIRNKTEIAGCLFEFVE